MMSSRILLVDDEANVLTALSRMLRRELGGEVQVETIHLAERALLSVRDNQYDAIISDYRMPGMDGLEFLLECRALQPDASRIILSGMTDFDVLMTAINEVGILRFLPKPWDDLELADTVRDAITATQRRRERHKSALRDQDTSAVLRELTQDEPDLLKVKWGPNGEVLLDDD
jgi:two-component system probable response regulator PhcQ